MHIPTLVLLYRHLTFREHAILRVCIYVAGTFSDSFDLAVLGDCCHFRIIRFIRYLAMLSDFKLAILQRCFQLESLAYF